MTFDADSDGRRLDAFLRRIAREDRLPGISAAVVDRDGERYATGIGARDVAGNRPATPDTLYGVGSVTKPVTATAVLQLADAGLCTVDDPISDHLGIDLGSERTDDSDADDASGTGGADPEPVRIRHLLTHTAGYPSLGTSEALIARRLRRGGGSVPLGDRADLYAHIEGAAGERVAPPGERRAYWNAGYGLLGDLIEAVTGKPYPEYVDEHVLAPLGADRATFDDTAFATDDDHMTQYLLEDSGPTVASLPTRDLSRAAGGLLASVRDLGAFLRAQLNGGAADGGRLLPAARAAQLHEPRVDTPEGRYGYGWQTREVCGRVLVGHAGSIVVSGAYAGFCPDAGLGVAIAANATPDYSLSRFGEAAVALALGEQPEAVVPFWRRRQLFDRLTGTYAGYRDVVRAAVRRVGGTLRLERRGPLERDRAELHPDDLGDGPPAALGPGDHVSFHALTAAGARRPAEFRFTTDGVRLVIDRWNLRRVDAEPPSEPDGP